MEVRRILVPLDFSAGALGAMRKAAFLARVFNAELVLLHVVELFEYTFNIYEPLISVNTAELENTIQAGLDRHVAQLEEEFRIQVRSVLSRGRVASEIAQVAIEREADLIIMGTHGAKGIGEVFIGTNAHRVVTLSPCPVITMRHDAGASGFSRIVMPIDDTLHSRQKVNSVISLALKCRSFVHVLGLLNSEEETDPNKFDIKVRSVSDALAHHGIEHDISLVTGRNLARESMEFAEQRNADLIAIMTDHESDLTGSFLGAFAKQIINHSSIPILSIRPMEGPVEYSFGGGGFE